MCAALELHVVARRSLTFTCSTGPTEAKGDCHDALRVLPLLPSSSYHLLPPPRTQAELPRVRPHGQPMSSLATAHRLLSQLGHLFQTTSARHCSSGEHLHVQPYPHAGEHNKGVL